MSCGHLLLALYHVFMVVSRVNYIILGIVDFFEILSSKTLIFCKGKKREPTRIFHVSNQNLVNKLVT